MGKTKLKTLKELRHQGFFCQAGLPGEFSIDERGVCVNELRGQAKKWLEELQVRMDYQNHKHDEKMALIHSIDWIKTFFNLEEEKE